MSWKLCSRELCLGILSGRYFVLQNFWGHFVQEGLRPGGIMSGRDFVQEGFYPGDIFLSKFWGKHFLWEGFRPGGITSRMDYVQEVLCPGGIVSVPHIISK